MNFPIATFAAAAVAFTAASVNAQETCNTTVIAGLLGSDDVADCATAASYSFTSLTTPTDTQIAAMCGDESCLSALAALEALNLGDCTVAGFSIMTELVEPIVTACNDTTTGTTTSSGSAGTETVVGEASTSGSDDTVEPQASTTSSGSEETTTEESSASDASTAASGSVGSSGSNSGAALTATSAIVGSVMLAAAMMA